MLAQQKAPASRRKTATATIGRPHDHDQVLLARRERPRRPHFGADGLISHDPHYPVWRAGAIPATALHTAADITIGDLIVPRVTTRSLSHLEPGPVVLIVNKQTANGPALRRLPLIGKSR